MGAIVDQTQMNTVLRYIESGRSEGARLLAGGEQALRETGGYYVQPTIFDGVRNDMTIAREEIFARFFLCCRLPTPPMWSARPIKSVYGLQAAVWSATSTGARCARHCERTVHVNAV